MLKAFLDASGKPEEDPVVVVAGFVSTTDAWEEFERRWNAFLAKNQLTRFHAAPFCARKRPYNGWDERQYQQAFADVCQIIKDMNPIGCGVGVNVEAFREWRSVSSSQIHPDPYYTCLDWTLRPLIRGVGEIGEDDSADDGITIYCDREANHEFLGKAAAEWHAEFFKKNAPKAIGASLFANPDRSIDMHYGSAIDYVPLQLADILAHCTFQLMRNSLKDPENWEKPMFFDAINACALLDVRALYTVEQVANQAAAAAGQDGRMRRGAYDWTTS
ncbi:MAG: DUF3800 domain-containing protein [Terricaulis sp.]|nr:DUF3800 domain-containing protein [Terricaulis sp.]